MPQSLSAVYVHLIFSTKGRLPLIRGDMLGGEMHAYLGGVSKQLDCPPLMVGGVEDHVHLLARLGRVISQTDWVKELKRISSQWVKTRETEEHHRKTTFQDEFRAFLQKHGMAWDERYVWD